MRTEREGGTRTEKRRREGEQEEALSYGNQLVVRKEIETGKRGPLRLEVIGERLLARFQLIEELLSQARCDGIWMMHQTWWARVRRRALT